MLEFIWQGFAACLEPVNLLAMLVSVPLGIVIGALPGFGAATGMIIILPLTYTMEPGTAFIAMCGIYTGAEYGGSISSILINTPGTGGAVITCFDGFPMARKGKARDALLISNISSFTGGIIGGIVMLLFMPIMASFALKFGAGEIFILAVSGLLLIGSISQGDIVKGIASAAIGLLLTCVGGDAVTGYPRFDFDAMILFGGLPFIPVMLGLFSVPYLINLVVEKQQGSEIIDFGKHGISENFNLFLFYFKDLHRRMLGIIVRSSLIGVVIGMIPGVGGAVATMVAYTSTKKTSKHPEKFGKGSDEGLAAPEAANNGIIAGSLIPVLSLGIPGSPAAAVFMGAIFLHGMTPGPNFLVKQPDLVYLLIISLFLCAIVQVLLGAFTIGSLANILRIPMHKLVPAVFVICAIGAYVVRGLSFDISLFLIFGIAAYFLLRLGFNLAAIILGLILGSVTESSLMEALTIASAKGGVITYFYTRKIAMVMAALIFIYIVYLIIGFFIKRSRNKQAASPSPENLNHFDWSGHRLADLILGVFLTIASLALLRMTQDFPGKSYLFPQVVLYILTACSLFLIARSAFFPKAYAGKIGSPFRDVIWKRVITVVIGLGIYWAGLTFVGFYIVSFFFVLACCILFLGWEKGIGLNKKHVINNLIYSGSFAIACYLVFTLLFSAQLPHILLP